MARQRRRTTRNPNQTTIDDLLDELPNAALECRELRHAWPRGKRGEMKMTPTKWRGERVVEAERRMECTGGCGVTRIDTYVFSADGRVYREGKPRYHYDASKPYLLKRDDSEARRVTVDRDRVRGRLFERMFPDLKW